MYDIEFAIPITLKSPVFYKRIEGFKSYGLLNIGSNKVILTLLTGTENVPASMYEGWPKNVSLNIVASTLDYNACKVYDYYSSHDLKARWYAKIDDDTTNDVSFLLKKLDEFGDHHPCYFGAKLDNYVEKSDVQLLGELGYHDWFYGDKAPWHEIEGSIISHAGMQAIKNNHNAMELIKRRAKLPFGFTDVCLAMAAQIANIYPIEARFMTHLPYICGFSMFGGPFGHLHQIAEDRNKSALEFFIKKYHTVLYDKGEIHDHLYNEFVNKEYKFYGANLTIPYGTVRFDPLYMVGNYNNFREYNWYTKNNKLYFVDYSGNITSEFLCGKNLDVIHGVNKEGIRLILRKTH